MSSTLDDCRWLVSAEGAGWLQRAAGGGENPLQLATHLRRDLSAERVHLVLQQIELRARGREKFIASERMFFTPLGLEQATDQWIAAHKARRFPPGAALADLCCGIGGDLLSLAARGPTVGVDRDPVCALFAGANLEAMVNSAAPSVALAAELVVRGGVAAGLNAGSFDLARCDAWHLDPDRRPTGRRGVSVVDHEPGLDVIEALLKVRPHGAIKLAPAAVLPEDWVSRAELEWISRKRECRQLVAWFGDLAQRPGRRSASVLTSGELRIVTGPPDLAIPLAAEIGRFVFEPDAAVLAAHLTGALAAEHALAAIAPGVAYLTGDAPLVDGALAAFEVLELLPLRVKTIKSWLQARGVGRLEIKKRGIDLDPAQLHRELRPSGDHAAVLLIAPVHGRPTVIAAQRAG